MFNKYRNNQYKLYQETRKHLIAHAEKLINLEAFFANTITEILKQNISEIVRDYNEASYLYPFWQQYPPDERGRQPRGDQYPWIEVGEHAVGDKLPRFLQKEFMLRDTGLPTGADKRFVLSHKRISELTSGLTESVWFFIDIKSAGPRDDFAHSVMSHNQMSDNGKWQNIKDGIKNKVLEAHGKYQRHQFYSSVAPLYILSDGTIAPVVTLVVKPIYRMLSLEKAEDGGQPLRKITVAAIPNGLLLAENPGYLNQYPGLLYPGKDDKHKNPLKVRVRVSFPILQEIDSWRVKEVLVE